MIALLMLTVFPSLMAFAAASDLVTMTISNRLSLALIGIFLLLAFWLGMPLQLIGWHLGTGCLVLVVTFALFATGQIGGGDAKLAAATAIWMGPTQVMPYLFLGSIMGGGLTLAILGMRRYAIPGFASSWQWLERLHAKENGVPYGIALAAAGLAIYPATEIWQLAAAF